MNKPILKTRAQAQERSLKIQTTKIFQGKRKNLIPDLKHHDLVVFSHLRWEFVTQRPQHIISRLSRGRKVLFVEESLPLREGQSAETKTFSVSKNITVLQPASGTGAYAEETIKRQIQNMGLNQPVLWFYSAGFLNLLPAVEDYSLIVYDCMDELSAFLGAPVELRIKEQVLISMADVVFTGGKSLYEAKKEYKEKVFCFPSSVDEKHFEKAKIKAKKAPYDIASLPGPRVGFYGVVDERLDLQLLGEIADRLPKVSFVVIGPVVKISEESLPKRPNIHYLGGKSYQQLPEYLSQFDIAMMPFALNESTKFISPTKTLEFMAGGKPIVSTPITDVTRDYSDSVEIAFGAQQFAEKIDKLLGESEKQRIERLKLFEKVLKKTSWNKTVSEMKKIMQETLKDKLTLDLGKS